MTQTLHLYRPVGLKEMELILAKDGQAFPPRLAHQPIFYPVLTLSYAEQIARDWNTQDDASEYAGFVTQFEIDSLYGDSFEVKTVGAREHQELWVPAEQLDEFNQHLTTRITLQAAFYGSRFKGARHYQNPEVGAIAQLGRLGQLEADNMAFIAELQHNWRAILLNYPYWVKHLSDQRSLLAHIARVWPTLFPELLLLATDGVNP